MLLRTDNGQAVRSGTGIAGLSSLGGLANKAGRQTGTYPGWDIRRKMVVMSEFTVL
ncbi:hypothetical protein [Citrobacter enshiensis]|uniref:hypothetical protein n=1 Tax=Citrobacter enshiensis TaxID=2971264 RepID=UPI0023E7A051|nr:hypothetical protein [Citrobacter enshiensis]WET41298.1 hypothetical protein P2W74_03405 [Citrobacter enshiensis]